MKHKILIALGIIIVILGILVFLYLNSNSNLVNEEISLIEYQDTIDIDIKGYTFEDPNVVLNPYEISPLTALISFETEEYEEVTLIVKGKDKDTTFEQTFESSKEHYVPVYGLYAGYENEITLIMGDEEKEIIINTAKLPEDFQEVDSLKVSNDYSSNELYFVTPSSGGYTAAYDANGEVRWYLTTYAGWKIDRLNNGNLLLSTERLVHDPYYNTGLYEMDMFGQIITEFTIPGGYHHDYFELENGNIIVATDNFNEGTVEDYIVEINRETGRIEKEIDLKDILNTSDAKSENWTEYDWFHNNSVWYDISTNSLTLSGRHQDAVINIDYETYELNWIIGDKTNWSEEYYEYFFEPKGDDFEWQWSQHAAMILPNGDVFIFDNGNNKSKEEDEYVDAEDSYSRGVIYDINTNKMTIRQVYEYGKDRGSKYYSPYVSDVDYVGDDHYLIISGGVMLSDGEVLNNPMDMERADEFKAYITEVKDDEVIFELVLDENMYRAEKMPLYENDKLFEDTDARVLGSTEETEKDSSFAVNILTRNADKVIEEYNINLTKEYDRLSFTGDFTKEDDVNIILHQGYTNYTYEVRVSETPYTALCVSIFGTDTEDDIIEAYKYINKNNLNGNYDILLELNGKLYDTDLVVNF